MVFITGHTELVLEAFRFKPAAFVPKQLIRSELPRALEHILAKETENPVFVTRKKNQDRIVELNQVLYLKYVYDHEVEFTLKDGSRFSETGSMKQFEAEPQGLYPHLQQLPGKRSVYHQNGEGNGSPGQRRTAGCGQGAEGKCAEILYEVFD